jgi:hypothetical protein
MPSLKRIVAVPIFFILGIKSPVKLRFAVNNYVVQELFEMEFAILTVMMLLITGVLMCYAGYVNSQRADLLLRQLEMVEDSIAQCENSYKLKKLIALRRKLKKKIDNY